MKLARRIISGYLSLSFTFILLEFIIKEEDMKIVELDDPRFLPLHCRNHLLGCKNLFYIIAYIGDSCKHFLIWPGGEINLQRAVSNKRMGRIKTKPVILDKDSLRCVVGSFGGSKDSWMSLKVEEDDYWTLSYDPATDVRILDEIIWILQRLKI
jgi:hypothetical protein